MSISYERVKELFDYREDGYLIWKVRKSRSIRIGDVAGRSCNNQYPRIQIDRKPYMAHRLIWLWHHGYMPEGELDHINKIGFDNRIENLREVSHQCNLRNTGNPKDNKTGVKGVFTNERWGDVWRAQIVLNGKQVNLGNHRCFDEAVLTRLAAEQCLDWDGCDSYSPAYRYAVKNGLIERG